MLIFFVLVFTLSLFVLMAIICHVVYKTEIEVQKGRAEIARCEKLKREIEEEN